MQIGLHLKTNMNQQDILLNRKQWYNLFLY